jgi:hypothetical protein
LLRQAGTILRGHPAIFAGDGHAFEPRAIDRDAQARAAERRGPAAPAEGEILGRQPLGHQQSIEASFEITNVGDRRREVSTGGGQDSRLSDLATELIAEPGLLRDRGDPQRRDETATLREPDVKQIARAVFDGMLGVGLAAQRFVQHHGDAQARADCGEPLDFPVRHRLFERRDAQRQERRHVRLQFAAGPGLVRVDPQVAAAADGTPHPEHGRPVVGAGHAHLHLALVETEQAEGQPAEHGFDGRERGQHRAVTDPSFVLTQSVSLGDKRGDLGKRTAASAGGRVEHGQFDGAPQRIAKTVALSRRADRVESNPVAEGDGVAQVVNRFAQHAGPVGRTELLPSRFDRLAGDIRTGQPFAPTFRTVVQAAADNNRMRIGAGMRGVLHLAPQRDQHVIRVERLDPHEVPRLVKKKRKHPPVHIGGSPASDGSRASNSKCGRWLA